MLINEIIIESAAFIFTTSIVAISPVEYELTAVYNNHAPQYLRIWGDDIYEEFANLELAVYAQDCLVAIAQANKDCADQNWVSATLKALLKSEETFASRLNLQLIESELVEIGKVSDEEEEVYKTIYSWRGFKLTQTFYGLDLDISVELQGIEVGSETFCFEGNYWPSPAQYIVDVLKLHLV